LGIGVSRGSGFQGFSDRTQIRQEGWRRSTCSFKGVDMEKKMFLTTTAAVVAGGLLLVAIGLGALAVYQKWFGPEAQYAAILEKYPDIKLCGQPSFSSKHQQCVESAIMISELNRSLGVTQ
jgi:hypothetical protein